MNKNMIKASSNMTIDFLISTFTVHVYALY